MKNFDYYLFDVDGTLIDSMPSYAESMMKILDDFGISYGEDLIDIITPLGTVGTVKYFVEELKVPCTMEEVFELMKKYLLEEYFYHIPAKRGVVETLFRLKEMGKRMCVLTASPHISLDPCLKRLGIFDLFENVWSCDDLNLTKKDPEIYRTVAEKMGTEPKNILFFDDNLHALEGAKKAGLTLCGVKDDASAEQKEEICRISDFYIEDFFQILDN